MDVKENMSKLIEKIKEKEEDTLVSDVIEVIPELNNIYFRAGHFHCATVYRKNLFSLQ